jgi:hypothetical protein
LSHSSNGGFIVTIPYIQMIFGGCGGLRKKYI